MAVTIAKVAGASPYDVWGKTPVYLVDITLDASYPTGGYAITAAQLGIRSILGGVAVGGNPAAAVLNYWWDNTNGKLMCFFPTGGATAAPTSLANPIVTTGAASATAVDATTPNITPGQGKQVGATADLHTITVRMLFVGA